MNFAVSMQALQDYSFYFILNCYSTYEWWVFCAEVSLETPFYHQSPRFFSISVFLKRVFYMGHFYNLMSIFWHLVYIFGIIESKYLILSDHMQYFAWAVLFTKNKCFLREICFETTAKKCAAKWNSRFIYVKCLCFMKRETLTLKCTLIFII